MRECVRPDGRGRKIVGIEKKGGGRERKAPAGMADKRQAAIRTI